VSHDNIFNHLISVMQRMFPCLLNVSVVVYFSENIGKGSSVRSITTGTGSHKRRTTLDKNCQIELVYI